MMKAKNRFLYLLGLLSVIAMSYIPAMAQTQTIRLFCAGGECAGLTFNLSGAGTVYVDWGDGEVVDYHGDIITGKCHEDTIVVTLPETITGFDCSGLCISWIDVSAAPLLVTLNCADNELEALDVDSLELLQELDCSGNQLATLSVAKNPALRYLDCSENQLTALDINQNAELQVLSCSENQLQSLSLGDNSKLSALWGSENMFGTLDLTVNPELTSVVLTNCGLRTLELQDVTKLQDLWIDGNALSSLNLKGADVIFSANVSNNRLESIDVEGYTVKTQTYLFDCTGNRLPFSSFYSATKVKNYVCGVQEPVDCGFDSLEIEVMKDFSPFITNAGKAKLGVLVVKDAQTDVELEKGTSDKDYQFLSGRLRFWHAVDSVYLVVTSSKYPDLEIRSNRFVVFDPKVGIHSVASSDGLQVMPGQGVLTLRDSSGEFVTVVSADGRVYWQGVLPSGKTTSIALPSGIYLVNGNKYKVK
jgi:hypothetical protein